MNPHPKKIKREKGQFYTFLLKPSLILIKDHATEHVIMITREGLPKLYKFHDPEAGVLLSRAWSFKLVKCIISLQIF